MSSFAFFLLREDKPLLLNWINQQEDLAFIVPTPQGGWKAVSVVEYLADGAYYIWHVPSGPLSMRVIESWVEEASFEDEEEGTLIPRTRSRFEQVENPWGGWIPPRMGWIAQEPDPHKDMPYFPYFSERVFILHLNTALGERWSPSRLRNPWIFFPDSEYQGPATNDCIRSSSLTWNGRYSNNASSAIKAMKHRFKVWLTHEAKFLLELPRFEVDGHESPDKSYWAFPGAYQAIQKGFAVETPEDLSSGSDLLTWNDGN